MEFHIADTFTDRLGKLTAVAGNVDLAVLMPDFMDREDVRMSHLRGGACFTQKLFRLRFDQVLLPIRLDRDDPIQFRVARLPDFAEGSLT